jgi:hypothetical protein
VVVREAHDVDRSLLEHLHQLAARAKVEVLRQLRTAFGKRALEIDDRHVGGVENRSHAGEVERP